MSIKKRISKIISGILTFAMLLSCMANATPVLAAGVASLMSNDVPTVYSSGNETASGSAVALYYDFGVKGYAAPYVQVGSNTTVDGCSLVTDGKDITLSALSSETTNPLYDGFRTNAAGQATITIDLVPGKYDIEMGIASDLNMSATYTFTSNGSQCVSEAITVSAKGTAVKNYEDVNITGSQLVLTVTADASKYGVLNYINIVPVIEDKVYTFGEADLDVKGDGFVTTDLAETEIGTTGVKIAVSSGSNYTNVLVRNNSSTNSGYYPLTQPTDNGYYLFLGAGGSNNKAAMTITLPETVPAGRAIDIEFVKILGTNNGSTNRGGVNNAQSMVIDTTTIDVKTGYEFTTWNTKTVVTENDISTITVNLGAWAAIGIKSITVREATAEDFAKVNVEFDLNGHGTTTPDSQELSVGSAAIEPTAPIADGYVFRGWYTDAACTNAWNFATGVTEDTILYAKWIIDPVVTVENALYTQSFSGVTAGEVAKSVDSKIGDMSASILTDDTHGFYLKAIQGGGSGYREIKVDFTNVDVSDKYNYTIEFDAILTPSKSHAEAFNYWNITGTDVVYSSGIVTEGYILKLHNQEAASTEYTVNDSETKINIPSTGWYHYKLDVNKVAGTVTINITGDTNVATDVVVPYNGDGDVAGFYAYVGRYYGEFCLDNIVVYEVVNETEATVSFDMNDVGEQIAPVTVTKGETYTAPTPAAVGYTFDGWYTDETLTTPYDSSVAVTDNLKLYAKWTEIVAGTEYKLVMDATGNTTAVNCTVLVLENVSGYRVTTVDAIGNIVSQYETVAQPTSVDTTGATKLEITPIFYYAIGNAASELGSASSYEITLPAGTYDFTVYNTSGNRCDVYADDQMLVNNILQYGSTPNYFTSKDIVTDGVITIFTADYDTKNGKTAADMNIQVKVVAAPSIANRTQKIYVLGDSLVAMYYNGCSEVNNLYQTGWGQVLADYLVDTVDVVDLGNSGITANGLYTTAFSQVVGSGKTGDILILESGYNDRSYDTEDVMKTALRNMISEAEAVGVTVILVSPNASSHTYNESVSWTNRMEAVVEETGVDYIDLSALSYNFFESLYEGDKTVMEAVWNVSDGLHSTYNAANKFAAIIAGELYNSLGYASLVNTSHVYTFVDTAGNVISCSANGATDSTKAKVTYDLNGQGGKTYVLATKGTKLTAPTAPSVFGYSFEGWFTDAACTEANKWDFDTDTVSADTVLYAKWVESTVWYSQDFTDVTDASTVATSTNNQAQVKIATDATHGNYLTYDFTGASYNSRGMVMNFGSLDVSESTKYVIEFDAAIKTGGHSASNRTDAQSTYFIVKGEEYVASNMNNASSEGYILHMVNDPTSEVFKVNKLDNVTVPAGEWCHYKLYVDKEQGYVSTTITNATGTVIYDNMVTAINGAGDVRGLHVVAGRYYPVVSLDNVMVRAVANADVFGEIRVEELLSVEFTSGINKTIEQPDSSSHFPLVIKAMGNLGSDLTDKVTVKWSMLGLDEEDGYISLTKASGTGEGTTGVAPDGTTAYFNVRNGVSNYYGAVKAEVTYGDTTLVVYTPFAVLGSSSADANQLAPAGGYPASMDEYADSMIGYVGDAHDINGKDVALNNWSIYGGNPDKTITLVKEDGKKALKFNATNGGGSAVAVYQWADQSSQYAIDFTAKFTAAMACGVYFNTPNNGTNNPEWTMSYADNKVTFGDQTISNVNANEWYRFVIKADPSTQIASIAVYNEAGTKIGDITDVAMTNDDSVQKYFCFMGTWPMYLNSFEAYKPSASEITVTATADTVAVPENGAADATVDLTATIGSNDGSTLTGVITWSLADEYANVEIASTGDQTARLTVKEGAAGKVTVVATMGSVRKEFVVTLTTTSDVVSFTKSTSSITIPFTGEESVSYDFKAVTLSNTGDVIDGGTMTYTLLAKDGETVATAINGVTFANGVLTVAAGANPAVVYVKAVNANGLSTKVKVNIHGFSFAFGSADPAAGYTHVTADTMYTDKLGFGFMSTSGLTANDANVAGTEDFRFKVAVPNGNYNVVLTTSASSVTSEVVESVPAVTGITRTATTFDVAVCDGVLDVTFPAGSTVSNVVITKCAAKTALEKPMIYAIGDSTTKNKVSASAQISWGNVVAEGLVSLPEAFSGFANHGKAGDDSVVYYNNARVEAVLLNICPGDYVTVNMGINSKTTGEAASYYTLLSEYFVEGIIQRGGIPVIVTATPDGPVGDRVSTNYNSATGKFTNSRGDSARNDVLRQIAAEKGLNIIELGQWGQDWMNTLTAADVTAYNAANGTSYTTVLELVQSWYADHNHYREYLAVQIAEFLLGELEDMTVDKTVVEYDFENETSSNWGMTGNFSSAVAITTESGNKYLKITTDLVGVSSVSKLLGLPKMTQVTVEFDWYVGGQTSTNKAGFSGVNMFDGSNEVLSLVAGEMRAAGETSKVYYLTDDIGSKVETSATVANGNWYKVKVDFDFKNDVADIYLDGVKIASDVAILEIAQKIDTVGFTTYDPAGGVKVATTMGIDDLSLSYVEKTAEDDLVTIYSVDAIDNIRVTKDELATTYVHPTTVGVLLTNGEAYEVEIDMTSWKCANFNANVKATYTWTADIIAPAQYPNNKGLKVSYVMEYDVPPTVEYDYYNDFTFDAEIIPTVAWGSGMNPHSSSGYMGLSVLRKADGDGYLSASVSNAGGDRGSRLDLNSGIISGATVSFDWLLADCSSTSAAELVFVSNSVWHSYFGLRYDNNYNISFYTKNDLLSSTTQEEYEGAITAADPVNTGLGGQNKWFNVTVTFDYLAHTADITIVDKANPANTFTQSGIAIDNKATGIRTFVMHAMKLSGNATATMGLDNIAVQYDKFTVADIVSVKNQADVSFSLNEFKAFQFPTTVQATMGDGSKLNIPITEWTATPEFDGVTTGEYVWTADLIVPEGYTNHFGLNTSFTMTYAVYPFPVYAYNPTTLELEFGEELPAEFPTEVLAHMNNGTIAYVEVGEWVPIREFNSAEEGIYVYGANIVPKDGVYSYIPEKLAENENPDDPSAQRDDYIYDVYYRVSYYEKEDNYNGYPRAMEYLDRGVYAVETNSGVYVSWRILVSEYGEDIAFNVYRNGKRINDEPITDKTNFVDPTGKAYDSYAVCKVQDGLYYMSDAVLATKDNYLSIPTQKPEPQPDKNGELETYTMNDAGIADVDGDGQYEVIIKWYPSGAFDSGAANGPSAPTIFDVYKLDGTPLWRLNLGLEMPSGAHFNPFMFYDLDSDGKAELFLKTSDGTVSYRPNEDGLFDMTDESTIISYIGDRSVTPGQNINANGHVAPATNEYVTVFNGLTGEEIDTVVFANLTGNYSDWGSSSDGGNRSARYNIAIAYLPADQNDPNCTETIPAVLYNRGYYAKTTVAAYALRDGEISLEWNYVTESGTINAAKGNHNMSTGDVDKDGFDELVIGALALDHDGTVLWSKNGLNGQDYAGHADSIHLAAMNPNNTDLYVFVPQEHTDATYNHSLSNAGTGTRWLASWFTKKDVGRGVAANITPNPGYEFWAASVGSGLYGFDGTLISKSNAIPMNWVLYWDGDLLSELGDGASTEGRMVISKYNMETEKCDVIANLVGTKLCNWSKNSPSLTADMLGDWREEIIVRNEDDTELRIYMTVTETDYMIYTLMHDPVYRNAVANQNTSYNQPAHVGIYLGEDQRDVVLNMQLDTAEVVYTTAEETGTTTPVVPSRPVVKPPVSDDDYVDSDDDYSDDTDTSTNVSAEEQAKLDEKNRERVEKRWAGNEGWQKVDGEWYYFEPEGDLKLGWVEDKDGKWYYMSNAGSMSTKWVQSPESKLWYYMEEENGHMLSNDWLKDPASNRWYYLDQNGAMCTGWIYVDNAWYYLDNSGAMCTGWNLVNGKWYLLGADGAMLSGWQYVNGKWYYMKEDGECLLDTTTPDGHKVDKDGARID